jgi:signal transduction histidine kinase
MVKQVRRDLRVLEGYILAARQQLKGESEPVNFSPVLAIRQVVRVLGARANKANTKLAVVCDGSPRIYGDLVKFRQVIANLINNAIDACETSVNDEPGKVIITVCLNKNSLTIKVKDNGPGMDPGVMGRIFEPFYSTKNKAGRSIGVGLDLVKRYVEQDFNGTVKVSSVINQGACFILTLPFSKIANKANFKADVLKIEKEHI